MEADRICHLTNLLDDLFYRSSIRDMRRFYFDRTRPVDNWFLFSDYYLEGGRPNNVITFTAMPATANLLELQKIVEAAAPTDIKHTRAVADSFIELINSLPIVNVIFLFDRGRFLIWNSGDEVGYFLLEYLETLRAYVSYWRTTTPQLAARLDRLARNLKCMETLLRHRKKIRLLAAMFLISLLGGFVGSLLCREADLRSLTWMSDRDSTTEICDNLIRDLFQITLIDITKRNIEFRFTTSKSGSEEWYEGMTRIPDYLTGAISGFDFTSNTVEVDKARKMLGLHFKGNIENTFLYRFKTTEDEFKLQRVLIL